MFETTNANSFESSFVDLTTVSDAQLEALISIHKLSLNVPFLREVAKCLSAERITPDKKILEFFDAIFLSCATQSENVNVCELFSDDEETIKTFSDLFTKHAYLLGNDVSSISLDDMVHVLAKYFSTLDISAPSSVFVSKDNKDISIINEKGENFISLGFDNSNPLPYGYQDVTSKKANITPNAKKNDLFILLSAEDTSTNYEKQIEELFFDQLFCASCNASVRIDQRGMLFAISELAVGASIYSHTENLTDLVTRHNNKWMIIISPENEQAIDNICKEHGICTTKVGAAISSPAFCICSKTGNINIRANFLRRIFRWKTNIISKSTPEKFEPTKYEPLYCTSNQTTDVVNGVICHKGHLISSLYTKKCSFVNGLNIVLDSVLSLVAAGASRKNIGITVRIGCKKQFSCDAISAILGVYRTAIELCIPEKDSLIELSDSEYIFCCAYAKADNCTPQEFVPEEESNVCLFSFGRFNDTTPVLMPDFSSIRKMCDAIEAATSKTRILSAKMTDGSVYLTAKEMCNKSTILFPVSNDNINEETTAQGVIVQLPKNSKTNNMPTIGIVKKVNYEFNV